MLKKDRSGPKIYYHKSYHHVLEHLQVISNTTSLTQDFPPNSYNEFHGGIEGFRSKQKNI